MNGQVLTKFDNSNDAHEVYEATCECNTDFVFAYTGETAQQFSCVAKSTVLPTDSDQIHHDCSVIESPITGVPKCLDCRSSNA
jgi:hypothetical protein